MNVDLRNAKPGDKLKSCHGEIMTYVSHEPKTYYPHKIKYANGSPGERTDSGHVMHNLSARLPTDHDIVEIIPQDTQDEKVSTE